MSAFIVLNRERRHTPGPRWSPVTDGPRDPGDGRAPDNFDRPLVTTTARVIAWLITLFTIVVVVVGFLFSNRFQSIVDSRFDRFELRLNREYALAKDTVPRGEYELRHTELLEREKQLADRITTNTERLSTIEGRLLAIERTRR